MWDNKKEMERLLGFGGSFMGGWVIGSMIGTVIANLFGIWLVYRIVKWIFPALFGG